MTYRDSKKRYRILQYVVQKRKYKVVCYRRTDVITLLVSNFASFLLQRNLDRQKQWTIHTKRSISRTGTFVHLIPGLFSDDF